MSTNAPAFEISAPGKVILNGEHSVVYGKHAIAGPIGLRTTFKLDRRVMKYWIIFEFPKLRQGDDKCVQLVITLANLNLFLKEYDFFTSLKAADAAEMMEKGVKRFYSKLYKYVRLGSDMKHNLKTLHCVTATLYLLNHIFRAAGITEVKETFYVIIDSDISIGAGMGSSASFGVCMAAGLYLAAETEAGRFDAEMAQTFSFKDNEQLLEKVNAWAFDSEIIMHDKPSGIDNTICTYGKLIIFKRGEPPVNLKFDDELQILIVDSNVGRSTAALVARVAENYAQFPKVFDGIFTAMEEVVMHVEKVLASGLKDKPENVKELEKLIALNNQLLRTIDVSHPKLEDIFTITTDLGFPAKITGAGGGGCVLVLLPPDFKKLDKYESMCDKLKSCAFNYTQTTIASGTGVSFRLMDDIEVKELQDKLK